VQIDSGTPISRLDAKRERLGRRTDKVAKLLRGMTRIAAA
jgi:ribosomal protein L13